eukprot:scaffold289_cov147-Amphora_coffeaeformis.AAC.15
MRQQSVTLKCLLSVVLLLLDCSVAFIAAPTPINLSPASTSLTTATSLDAKKRRRRKSDATPPTGSSDDDLPDFDIDNPGEAPILENEKTASKSPSTSLAKSKVIRTTVEGEEITAAMMGTAGAPTKSVRDLLNDRSLEQKLSFDDGESTEELPDLMQMARTSTTTTTPRTTAVDKGTVREKAKQAEQKEVFSLDSLSGVKILET